MKTYNLSAVYCTINGIRIQGFDADDAISVEPASDDIEDSVGADGEATASVINDDRMYVDITVRENSKGAQDLGTLRAAQRAEIAAGLGYTPLPFLLVDGITGETMSGQYTVFKTSPGPSKGRLVSGRTFRVLVAKGKASLTYAPSVTA